jgi:hypothetical protein
MLAVAASDLLPLLECQNSGGFTDPDLNITPLFAKISRVPFRLDDVEDARYGHILLNNSVDIRVRQDAAGQYLDEEGHLLRRIGTLNAKVDRFKCAKRCVSTEDAEAFTTCDTGTEMRSLRTYLGTYATL